MKRIINSIKKLLTLDNSSPESYEHSLKKKTLFFFSLVIFSTLFLIAILNAFIFPDSEADAIILLCSSLFCLISIYLNVIDKYKISATMIMIAIFSGIVFNMASSNGIYDPGATALVILIIISSLFYDRIYVIFFTFLSIIAYTAILVFQYLNYIGKKVPYLLFDGSVFIILILITGFCTAPHKL